MTKSEWTLTMYQRFERKEMKKFIKRDFLKVPVSLILHGDFIVSVISRKLRLIDQWMEIRKS